MLMIADLFTKNFNTYTVEREIKSVPKDYFMFSDTLNISEITVTLLVNNFPLWLLWVSVAACRIFSCDVQTLSGGMWDLVPCAGLC